MRPSSESRLVRAIGFRHVLCLALAGCAAVVSGNERALFYSAGSGMSKESVSPGWYWHWPWNHYEIYDIRWTSHREEIHIHSKDNLHLNLDVVVVVRPDPVELYALHTEAGPNFYDELVKPAVYGATRDACARFGHIEIATRTHEVETAIRDALLVHLDGQHIEVAEVAIQHFDLPPEVEEAANRKAGSSQLLAAKEVDLALARSDAEIKKAQVIGALEVEGAQKQLRSQQELEEADLRLRVEQAKRKADLELAQAQADEARVRAQGEADAIRLKAEAEKARIAALSQGSANYVRVQALDALARAMSGGGTKLMVFPFGKDGLPAFFAPFLNPFQTLVTDAK
jgi:regulator of protease activity HflC (stomatin/prohibitin superfamily)